MVSRARVGRGVRLGPETCKGFSRSPREEGLCIHCHLRIPLPYTVRDFNNFFLFWILFKASF